MTKTKQPTILSIDTSCDDTSVAVTQGLVVLSNVVASQTQLHKQYGGVFPTVAKQAHKENIDPCIKAALQKTKKTWEDIDAVAVTQGPGLAPALEVGISKAKELAIKYHEKLIAINHIEGHALSVLAQRRHSGTPQKRGDRISSLNLPDPIAALQDDKAVLSLVISGGHSEFILIKNIGEYEILGQTVDDSAGECLDKVGRMLGLGYPAGAVIEKFARLGNEKRFAFPLPMTETKNFNLSFSGLKTFARNKIEDLEANKQLDKQAIYDFCASFQYAVFRHITYKLGKILTSKKYQELALSKAEGGQVWLGGGVAANNKLRGMIRKSLRDLNSKSQFLSSKQKLKLVNPFTKKLCSDNAAMIGVVANFKFQKDEFVKDLDKLERKPRWKIVK